MLTEPAKYDFCDFSVIHYHITTISVNRRYHSRWLWRRKMSLRWPFFLVLVPVPFFMMVRKGSVPHFARCWWKWCFVKLQYTVVFRESLFRPWWATDSQQVCYTHFLLGKNWCFPENVITLRTKTWDMTHNPSGRLIYTGAPCFIITAGNRNRFTIVLDILLWRELHGGSTDYPLAETFFSYHYRSAKHNFCDFSVIHYHITTTLSAEAIIK